ncbi:type I restriction endonuclease subunit S [Paucibacter aquatile]|uniref:Type I restriction endonuclease subunit S n=1 Tax=Kinneretia aquatilis TaxID=2070761 RepID=A0A2N8KV81_9BURK|nr:restriction endonuclease subunit S [Paucibacter aquatile]PND37378.1 type I restriction endonuclease subunit S [Paucibacter aquatile]
MSHLGLPAGWAVKNLGDLVEFKYGKALPDKVRSGAGFPVFGSNGEVGKHEVPLTNGPTIVVGRKGSVGQVHYCPGACSPIDTTYYVDEVPGRQFGFWRYQLRSLGLESLNRSTAIPGLNRTDAYSIRVNLPPLAEQVRIADKLDTVLARVDAVTDRLARVAPLLKRFRQSVLAAATSGRLTEEWRDINKPTKLLAEVQLGTITQERLCRMKKAKNAAERTRTEEFDVPQSWLWTSLDALTAKIVDGTHHTPTYVSEGVPFVSVKDIRDGVIDFSNTKFITEEEHCELSKRCPVEQGDLLITKSGTIGRTAIVKTNSPFSLFVSVALLKPASREVNMRFIDLALQDWIGRIDVSSRIVGSTIKNLHLVDMKVLGIPFPSLDEQAEIVRRVELLVAFADRLEARLQTAQTAAQRLTPALLAKAFRGELVPQDPNDEPAAELLKRLAAARDSQAAKPAKRGRSAVKT